MPDPTPDPTPPKPDFRLTEAEKDWLCREVLLLVSQNASLAPVPEPRTVEEERLRGMA